MNSKIYTALLVIFCVVQGLSARSTHDMAKRISVSDEDIVQILNEYINKIHKSIENIEEVIQNLEQKVKEDLSQINLPHIIAELEKKIEDITEKSQSSAVVIVKCLLAEQQALRELEYIINKGLEICLSEADQTKNEITKMFIEISVKAASSISNLTGGIMKCFGQPSDKINNCLEGLVEPSMEEVTSVLAEIELTIEDSQKLVEETDKNLSECVDKVQNEIVKKENDILGDYQKCVRI